MALWVEDRWSGLGLKSAVRFWVEGVEGLTLKGVRGTLCGDRICVLVKTDY